MRNIINIFGLILVLNLNISCDKENSIIETGKLQGEQILEHEFGVTSLYFVDNYLLVKMNKKIGYGLSLYDRNNLKTPIVNFARFGDGPDEWGAIRVNGQTIEKNDKKYLVLNDAFKNRIRLLDFDKLIQDSIEVYDYTYEIDSRHGLTQTLNFINDSIIVSTSGIDSWEHGRLKFYNLEKDSSWVVPLFPEISDSGISPYNQYMLYFSYIHYNQERRKIASSMDAFDRIDIFDLKGELLKTFEGSEKNVLLENKSLIIDGNIPPYSVYYKFSTSSKDYIYGLYYNQLNIEIEKVEIKPEIRVLDWNGKLIKVFEVDEYLSAIEVDEKNQIIIGIDYLNEKIIKYELPNSFLD